MQAKPASGILREMDWMATLRLRPTLGQLILVLRFVRLGRKRHRQAVLHQVVNQLQLHLPAAHNPCHLRLARNL